jgi:hypothetical protein
MIFHSEYDGSAYHLVDSIELRCPFDAEALQTAIAGTVAAHPALRTAFDMGGYSEPLQLVFSADKVFAEIAIDDWRDVSAGRQREQLRVCLALEASRPFAIAQAPLIRFHVHRLDDDRLRFTVAEHHAILDGWSLVSMLNEMFSRYPAALKKTAPPLMEPVRANATRDLDARPSSPGRTAAIGGKDWTTPRITRCPPWPDKARTGPKPNSFRIIRRSASAINN